MGIDHSSLQAMAKNLIGGDNSLGRIMLNSISGGTFDAVEGETIGGIANAIPLNAVSVPVTSDLVDGKKIKATDTMVLADSDTEPTLADTISVDGEKLEIVHIIKVAPTGLVIMYKVICRA